MSIGFIFSVAFMYATPLIFASLGGTISERSGVTNIGIEGMMIVGAFMGAFVGYYSGNPWLALLCAALGGMLLSLLHAIAAVIFNANQIISGVALNLIGLGISLFLSRRFFDGATQTLPVPNKLPKFLTIPSLNIDLNIMAPISILAIIFVWLFLFKTVGGLRLRSVGEHPTAADTLGINVNRTRFIAVLVSGAFGGIGGAVQSLAVVSTFSSTVISGHGYIALAAVIFGRWNPIGVALACLLFGLSQAIVVILGGTSINIPSSILAMLPYFLTILTLILFRSSTAAPKASGQPYEKGQR